MSKGMKPIGTSTLLGSGVESQSPNARKLSMPHISVGSGLKETLFEGRRKWLTLGGIALLWSFAGYNKDWIWSPTDTADKILDAAGWVITIPDRMFDDDVQQQSVSDSTIAPAPNSSQLTQPSTIVSSGSGGSNNLVPVVPTETTAVATTQLDVNPERIPTFVYSGDADGGWKVSCYGPAKEVTINEQAGSPLRQIQEATNENWAVGKTNSQADTQLYEIVRRNAVSEVPLVLSVFTDCEGLDN